MSIQRAEPPAAGGARHALSWPVAVIVALLTLHVAAAVYLATLGTPRDDAFHGVFYADQGRLSQIVDLPGRPYRDFDVEYPPLVLAELHGLMTPSPSTTLARFAYSQLALELVVVGAIAWGWGKRAVLAYLMLSLPLIAFPFIFSRTDMLASALGVLGMAAVAKRSNTLGAVSLAIAVFAKLWPVVLAPVLLVRGKYREFAIWAAVGAIGLVAWVAWGGVSGPVQVVTFRHADGWSIESGVGGLWHLVGATPHEINDSFRVGHSPQAITLAAGVATALFIGWLWWLAADSASDSPTLFGVVPLTAVAALMLASPLFSAQYVLWLLPWCAIATAELDVPGLWRNRRTERQVENAALAALVFGTCAATVLTYRLYGSLVLGSLPIELLLVLRNLAILATVAIGVRRLLRSRVKRHPDRALSVT